MNLDSLIKDAEKYYSEEWGISSLGYQERGYYDWCINEIRDCRSVFEIGSGVGISTEKIVKNNSKLTSIEENVFNFKKTAGRLENAGIKFGITNRYNSKNFLREDNNLILGNFITDKNLHEDVIKQLDFDCIVCWCMGVHPATHAKKELRNLGYKESHPPTYRDFIYDILFSETSKYLKEGGVINLIERSEFFPNESVVNEHTSLFTSYYSLEKYGLKIIRINQLKIESIHTLPGIKMEVFDGNNLVNKVDEKKEHCLTSTTITKS